MLLTARTTLIAIAVVLLTGCGDGDSSKTAATANVCCEPEHLGLPCRQPGADDTPLSVVCEKPATNARRNAAYPARFLLLSRRRAPVDLLRHQQHARSLRLSDADADTRKLGPPTSSAWCSRPLPVRLSTAPASSIACCARPSSARSWTSAFMSIRCGTRSARRCSRKGRRGAALLRTCAPIHAARHRLALHSERADRLHRAPGWHLLTARAGQNSPTTTRARTGSRLQIPRRTDGWCRLWPAARRPRR